MSSDKYLFLGCNTADGFIGFFDDIIDMYDLEKLYILKGGHGIGKSTFIRKFAEAFPKQTKDFLICAGDPKSLDGVVIPALKIAVIDGTHPHPIDPIYPGIIDEIINLGKYIDPTKVTATKQTIKDMKSKKSDHYKKAFAHLNAARLIHHKLESFYKDAVDFEGANKILVQLINDHT